MASPCVPLLVEERWCHGVSHKGLQVDGVLGATWCEALQKCHPNSYIGRI